jgi:pSer/pThr/pTyr-binding forkhead associated (FHA) protein
VSDKPANPTAPTDPGKPAPAAEAPAPPPPEENTQPIKLSAVWEKAAKKRRRTTAAELIMQRPKQTEVRVPLDRTEMVIGRDAQCDIVLTDDGASRRHASIARNAGGYFELTDLGSENGVLVDGERVARMTLVDGDAFTIGDTQFRIVVGPIPGVE